MKDITKKYTNGEVTVVWKPSVCIHSAICWRGEQGLNEVFNPAEKPWIKPEGADTSRIIEQIKKCPSGALENLYKRLGWHQLERLALGGKDIVVMKKNFNNTLQNKI